MDGARLLTGAAVLPNGLSYPEFLPARGLNDGLGLGVLVNRYQVGAALRDAVGFGELLRQRGHVGPRAHRGPNVLLNSVVEVSLQVLNQPNIVGGHELVSLQRLAGRLEI